MKTGFEAPKDTPVHIGVTVLSTLLVPQLYMKKVNCRFT